MPPITLIPQQRELLLQALTDAIYYRDPPVDCVVCEKLQGTLCKHCAAALARARAYLDLRREMALDASV